jgi:hypothetical protein
MHIRIHRRGRTIHLLDFFDYQRALDAGVIEAVQRNYLSETLARNLISEHFRDSQEIGQLRDVLARQVYGLNRRSDQFVIDAAVRCLKDGDWCVAYDRTPTDTAAVAAPSQASAPASQQRQVDSPARDRRPAVREAPPPPRSAPVQSRAAEPLPDPEWTDDIDQIAFAEVLERAAREAKPFCEVCARAAAQRARATQ